MPRTLTLTRISSTSPVNTTRVARKQQGVAELKMNYMIDQSTKVIGTGKFGKTFKTYNKNDPSLVVAIKVIEKDLVEDMLGQMIAEVGVLNKIDHPNIVKHIEDYVDEKFIYIGKGGKSAHF